VLEIAAQPGYVSNVLHGLLSGASQGLGELGILGQQLRVAQG
jgi:hypothetical protein